MVVWIVKMGVTKARRFVVSLSSTKIIKYSDIFGVENSGFGRCTLSI